MFLRSTLAAAFAAASLAVTGTAAYADPAWTASDSVPIVYSDGVMSGTASCVAGGAGMEGGYATVTATAYDDRGAELYLGCTLWQGGTVVFEASGAGLTGGYAAVNATGPIPEGTTKACVWGWWTVEWYTRDFGDRNC